MMQFNKISDLQKMFYSKPNVKQHHLVILPPIEILCHMTFFLSDHVNRRVV